MLYAIAMKTYIVRIYRFKKDNPRSLVGVVEEVGVKGKKAFTNYDELWDILISSKSIMQKQQRKEVINRKNSRKLKQKPPSPSLSPKETVLQSAVRPSTSSG